MNILKFFKKDDEPSFMVSNKDFSVKHPFSSSIEELQFVFSQIEKRLDESGKIYDATTNKTVVLLSISIGLMTTLTAYFFINNELKGVFSPKLFTVFVMSFKSFFILFYLSKNILPTNYHPLGSKASLLLNKEFYIDMKNNETLKSMIYSEIVNYDSRANDNFQINEKRLKRIKNAIISLIILPLLGLVIYLLSSLFCFFI
ncbi:accessory gene regulator protein AgrB [Catalinimonas alkaloidigena]|nr:accessory gene regulator protein AgrB [Catalinimonas alkaloidigena]